MRHTRPLVIAVVWLGASAPAGSQVLTGDAAAQWQNGDVRAALVAAQAALASAEAAHATRHVETARMLWQVACLERRLGSLTPAREHATRALAIAEAVGGPASGDVATASIVLGEVEFELDRLPDAQHSFDRALRIRRSLWGDADPRVAEALVHCGDALTSRGQPDSARTNLDQAVRILEGAPGIGAQHPDTAGALLALARCAIWMGDPATALPLADRALRIYEQAYGPRHPDVAQTLQYTANTLQHFDRLKESGERLDRALALTVAVWGPDDPHVARVLVDRATLEILRADLAAAVRDNERAFAIAASYAASEPLAPDLAFTAMRLARTYRMSGDAGRALPLAQRAVTAYEKLGRRELATSLGELANCHAALGELVDARRCRERVLDIQEQTFGPQDLNTARALVGVALSCLSLGDVEAAHDYDERALQVFSAVHGVNANHLDMAYAWMHSGVGCEAIGDTSTARVHYERGLAIYESHKHLNVAWSCENLGALYAARSDYETARKYQLRALETRRRGYSPDHPSVAQSYLDLARIDIAMGHSAAAIPLLRRSVAMREQNVGKNHDDVAAALVALATAEFDQGNDATALAAALRAEDIARTHLSVVARTLPEGQALRYAAGRTRGLDVVLSIAARADGDPAVSGKAFDALVRSRALVLDAIAARNVRRASEGETGRRLRAEHQARLEQYARLLVESAGGDAREQQRIDTARIASERAEAALAQHTAPVQTQTLANLGAAGVLHALPHKSVLVSYFRFAREPTASPGRRPSSTETYIAFVVREGRDPRAVDLGSAVEIDGLVSQWRACVAQRPKLGAVAEGAALDASRRTGDRLRSRIWDPVASECSAESLIFVVPDGALNLVNFAALPAGASQYLVETAPPVQLLSTERELAAPAAPASTAGGLLAVGDPDYDDATALTTRGGVAALRADPPDGREARAGTANSRVEVADATPFRGPTTGCENFVALRFRRLQATAAEVEQVARLYDSAQRAASRAPDSAPALGPRPELVLTGSLATEQAVKHAAPRAEILHFATHGFFVQGDCLSAFESARGIGGLRVSNPAATTPVASESPLRLSGLVFAGANHRAAAAPEDEDGVLTAEEIAALDLSSVRWAVLSACDTGVGEVRAGEGIFGLRRAFQVAGARTLIMSLWSVEDRVASDWMRELYANRFQRGLTTIGAATQATRTLLQSRRAAGLPTHPFYWGGFVVAGDWR